MAQPQCSAVAKQRLARELGGLRRAVKACARTIARHESKRVGRQKGRQEHEQDEVHTWEMTERSAVIATEVVSHRVMERLGDYDILNRVAMGGMAEIFRARSRSEAGSKTSSSSALLPVHG